jgi:carbonic anhydrase
MKKNNWSYMGSSGPMFWGGMCSDFMISDIGEEQSPIDIEESEVCNCNDEVNFHYTEDQFSIVIENHTFRLYPSKGKQQCVVFNDTSYKLDHIHAHIPSEHTLNHRYFSMEWHFVHKNARGNILVLAVWGNVEDEGKECFSDISGKLSRKETSVLLNPSDMISKYSNIFTYRGSLTTPPTSEGVTWLILRDIQPMNLKSHLFYSCFLKNNCRPVQKLNHRKVKKI